MISLLFEVDMMMTIISEREFYCFMDDVKQASCYTQLIVTLATQKKNMMLTSAAASLQMSPQVIIALTKQDWGWRVITRARQFIGFQTLRDVKNGEGCILSLAMLIKN